MIRRVQWWVALPLLLAACGVPQSVVDVAKQEATASATQPAEDGKLSDALDRQASRWQEFSAGLRKREFLGVWPPDEKFVLLVDQTAALAKRQAELAKTGESSADQNREALKQFHQLWQKVDGYFGE